MPATTTLVELFRVEKQREQELEEARVIQSAMLPACPLHTENVIISHEFQPVTDVGCLTARSGCAWGMYQAKGCPQLYAALAVGTYSENGPGAEPGSLPSE